MWAALCYGEYSDKECVVEVKWYGSNEDGTEKEDKVRQAEASKEHIEYIYFQPDD